MFHNKRGGGGEEGLSLIEVMVAITILLLGVVVIGGGLIIIEQGAAAAEEHYLDYSDVRSHIEELKCKVGDDNSTLQVGENKIEEGTAGYPNLIRMDIKQGRNREYAGDHVRIVTYRRLNR